MERMDPSLMAEHWQPVWTVRWKPLVRDGKATRQRSRVPGTTQHHISSGLPLDLLTRQTIQCLSY